MNKLTFAGIVTGILVFIFPFVVSHRLFYAAINVKTFFIAWAVLGIGLVFIWLLLNLKDRIFLPVLHRRAYLLWATIVLLFTYILSSILGINIGQSFFSDILRGVGVWVIAALFIWAYILSALLTRLDFRYIGKAVIASGTLFSIIYIVSSYIFPGTPTFFTSPDLLFGNSTFTGTFVLFGAIATLLALGEVKHNTKIFWFLMGSLVLQILNPVIINPEVLTGSIGVKALTTNPLLLLGDAQASAAVLFLILFFCIGRFCIRKILPNQSMPIRGFSVIVGAGVFVALVLFFTPGSSLQQKYIENSSAARVIVWEDTVQAIKERPLLGWGPENFDMAIQKHFDNRLFLKENLGEIWFDKAHNIFLDTVIEIGIIGLVGWILVWFFSVRIFYLAQRQKLISENQAMLLTLFICGNILQLQTSFQTATTYMFTFLLLGYALYLERELFPGVKQYNRVVQRVIGILLFAVILGMSHQILIKEKSRQHSIVEAFSIKDEVVRKQKIEKALSRKSGFESLRLLSGSFMKGFLIQMGEGTLTSEGLIKNKAELLVYEKFLTDYVERFPMHYRARVNLAYVYMLETIAGDNKIKQAQAVLQGTYVLSPEHPLTYALDALAFLYAGDIAKAESKAKEAIAINSQVEFSQKVLQHIEKQKKTLPEITFLKLENL